MRDLNDERGGLEIETRKVPQQRSQSALGGPRKASKKEEVKVEKEESEDEEERNDAEDSEEDSHRVKLRQF
jgi:hypothetical protein